MLCNGWIDGFFILIVFVIDVDYDGVTPMKTHYGSNKEKPLVC